MQHKPRKPIKVTPTKKRLGKKAAAWIEERHQWIKDNPPPYNGKWQCYLRTTPLCPNYLDIDQLTLDHEIPRSSLRNTPDVKPVLRPCCTYCNGDKGSMSLDNYLAKIAKKKVDI